MRFDERMRSTTALASTQPRPMRVSPPSRRPPREKEKATAPTSAASKDSQRGSSHTGASCGSGARKLPSQKASATPTPEICVSAAPTKTTRRRTTYTPRAAHIPPARRTAAIESRQKLYASQKLMDNAPRSAGRDAAPTHSPQRAASRLSASARRSCSGPPVEKHHPVAQDLLDGHRLAVERRQPVRRHHLVDG